MFSMPPLPSFSNPMAAAGDASIKKLKLKATEAGVDYEFAYNPTSFSLDRSVSWDDAQAMKEQYGILNFTGGQSDNVSFTTMLDCSETGGSIMADVQKLYKLTEVKVSENNYKRPAITSLTWGDFKFVGVVTNLKIDFSMFDEKGNAVRADVSITLLGRSFSDKTAKADFFAPFK